MAGQKFLPHGTTVAFASADIGGIVGISLPDRSKGQAEATDNDSAGDREYLPGLREGGTLTLTCHRVSGDAGQAACETNYEADRTVEECVVTFPPEATTDSSVVTLTFDCFVMNYDGGDMAQDSDETAKVTIVLKVTGGVSEAAA